MIRYLIKGALIVLFVMIFMVILALFGIGWILEATGISSLFTALVHALSVILSNGVVIVGLTALVIASAWFIFWCMSNAAGAFGGKNPSQRKLTAIGLSAGFGGASLLYAAGGLIFGGFTITDACIFGGTYILCAIAFAVAMHAWNSKPEEERKRYSQPVRPEAPRPGYIDNRPANYR